MPQKLNQEQINIIKIIAERQQRLSDMKRLFPQEIEVIEDVELRLSANIDTMEEFFPYEFVELYNKGEYELVHDTVVNIKETLLETVLEAKIKYRKYVDILKSFDFGISQGNGMNIIRVEHTKPVIRKETYIQGMEDVLYAIGTKPTEVNNRIDNYYSEQETAKLKETCDYFEDGTWLLINKFKNSQ